MPLTIDEIRPNGFFVVTNEKNDLVGTGKAKASKTVPGMVTLFFTPATLKHLDKGIRVPINWLETEITSD